MPESSRKLESYALALSILIPLLSISFSAWRFIDLRVAEQRQQSFENYHGLIERLSTTRSMDTQAAIIFELRNYPAYKDVSIRILNTYLERWKDFKLLKTEMDETIESLKNQ